MIIQALSGQAVLFDCDGVLVDSLESGERAWTQWSREYGVDESSVLDGVHGRRSEDTVARVLPNYSATDQVKAARRIEALELETVSATRAMPGAEALLTAVTAAGVAAIVTSAPTALFTARLRAAGLSAPAVVVTGPDVKRGKPAPDAYLYAASLLAIDIERCIVIEDSEAGIEAARAAGAHGVLGIGPGALMTDVDLVVADLSGTSWTGLGLQIAGQTLLRSRSSSPNHPPLIPDRRSF
ncbi:HAD-IA family hydrolase [Herbiconiux sp. UC225_62]|uniref:HAD-IA family hydrolase n=1 Tax=Herbiconiux sp. UC225_62 TaxID=3350168 RepID=UPI0036D347C2